MSATEYAYELLIKFRYDLAVLFHEEVIKIYFSENTVNWVINCMKLGNSRWLEGHNQFLLIFIVDTSSMNKASKML